MHLAPSILSTFTTADGTSAITYDNNSQITCITDSGGGTLGYALLATSYTFDQNGNDTTNGVGDANQLSNLTYDNEGNVTYDGTYTYTWDGLNRLIEVTDGTIDTRYVYDSFNRRVLSHVFDGTDTLNYGYVYDGIPLAALAGLTDPATSKAFMWGPNNQLLEETTFVTDAYGYPSSRWALTDYQGNVRDVLATDGTVLNHIMYDAQGTVDYQSDPTASLSIMSQGMQYDRTTNMNYAINRYELNGRWLSADPANADVNTYRVDGNDPVNHVDPSGLDFESRSSIGWAWFAFSNTFLSNHAPSPAPAPAVSPPVTTPSYGGGSGQYPAIDTHFTDANDLEAMKKQEAEVTSNVMPGLPPKATDYDFGFDLKSIVIKHLKDRTVSLPFSFEVFSKEFLIGDVPAFTEVTASFTGGIETEKKTESTCAKFQFVLELGVYIGAKIGESQEKEGTKALEALGEKKLLKAEHITQEVAIKKGEEADEEKDAWKINGKAFISVGLGRFSAGIQEEVPLGTLGYKTGLKLHVPNLSEIKISKTSGEGSAAGFGLSAEHEDTLGQIDLN